MGSTNDRVQGLGGAFSLLAGFLATSVVAGVLGAGLLMPAAGVTGSLARDGVDFFDSLPEELEVSPLSQQSRILYADGTPMATFFYENRISVPLSSVAPVARQAVIAIEDSRFYEHAGADPKGILRAMLNNASGGDTQGASTLTQQWVKNVLLEQALQKGDKDMQAALRNPDKGRKLREIKLAISAEKQLTKDEILQNYLNIALFGDGAYGIETASRHFLSKSAADLTLPDAALMAGLLQSPARYDPVDAPEAALNRRNVVLARMLELDMITQAEHDEAKAVPLEAQVKPQESRNGCEQAGGAAFFCDYVVRIILKDPSFGEDEKARQRLLYRGGLTITTTLDRGMQTAAHKQINESVPANEGTEVSGSIVSVQPGTGRILAMAQNRVYNPREATSPGTTSLNYNTSYEYGGSRGFQPGSTFKPLVLAAWLKAGRSLNDTVDARHKVFDNEVWDMCGGRYTSDPYGPNNAGDGMEEGRLKVIDATYKSINTAYAQMGSELRLCDIRDTATSLGVVNARTGEPVRATPSMVLGVEEVSPLSMAGAFGAFAHAGTYCKPVAILSVTDPAGTKLAVPTSDCAQALPADVANGVTAALQNTLTKGTAKGHEIGRPAAGKTGTTNGSVATWFVGYTPQVSTAVWLGYEQSSRSLNYSIIKGEKYRRMYGSTVSAPIWDRYMTQIHQGVPAKPFPAPSDKVLNGERVRVPNVVGKSVDAAKNILTEAGFKPVVGSRVYSNVGEGRVGAQSPGSGDRARKGGTVTLHPSKGPEPAPPPPPPAPEPAPAPAPEPAPPPAPKPPPADDDKEKPKPPPKDDDGKDD